MREDLYGYTRDQLRAWLTVQSRAVRRLPVLAETRELSGRADAGPAEVAEILCGWLNSDVKAAPLKSAQGLICAEGFRTGALHGEFFADVPAAHARPGTRGGVAAVRVFLGFGSQSTDWFTFARGGDLSGLISGWFDLANAGPKREAGSYDAIAAAIGTAHADPVPVRSSRRTGRRGGRGLAGAGVDRPGEPNSPRPPHHWVASFADVTL